jgi:RHS repeat-associated protein
VIEYGYDAENRLVSVSAGEMQVSFLYDGDGQRVASLIDGEVTVYIGEVFEWDVTDSSMMRYYYGGAQRVAIRTGSASPVWLLGDHLGSTSVAANTDGSLLSRQGYLPWGELRYTEGSLPGRYQFTGQASYEAEFGLYYYKARWYDPHLGRFSQPDNIVPQNQGIQAWDRYAYVNNSPINFIDLSGHMITECGGDGQDCNASTGEEYRDYIYNVVYSDEIRQRNSRIAEWILIDGLEIILSILWEPADWILTARDCLTDSCSFSILIGLIPLVPSSIGTKLSKYDVGLFTDLRKASCVNDDLALRHAPQKNPASQVISNYDPLKGPAIALPTDEHLNVNSANIIGPYNGSTRDLLAKTISDLRNYTRTPNLSLWQLVELFNQIYPGALKK